MKYSFVDFVVEIFESWNSKELLLSRGIGSTITGVVLLIVIYNASIPDVSKFDLLVAKGFWGGLAICLFLFGVNQLGKVLKLKAKY